MTAYLTDLAKLFMAVSFIVLITCGGCVSQRDTTDWPAVTDYLTKEFH